MDTLATLIKQNPPSNAVDLIKTVKNHVQNPELIVPVLETIASGVDGISGTDDDLINPDIIQAVKQLIELDIVKHIASEIKIQVPKGLCCFGAL